MLAATGAVLVSAIFLNAASINSWRRSATVEGLPRDRRGKTGFVSPRPAPATIQVIPATGSYNAPPLSCYSP